MISWLRRLGNRSAPGTTATAVTNGSPATAVPTPSAMAEPPVPHDKIAARAYEIWVRKGKPQGLDLQNWAEAERELRAEFARSAPESLPRKAR